MATIAVIGAGVMGRGVAQIFSEYKYRVILIDLHKEILDKAKTDILRGYQVKKMFSEDGKTDPEEILKLIMTSTNLEEVTNADYIIENISEKLPLKIELYKKLSKICSNTCIILANTSCIPITKLASYMRYPENVIGAHFMNPVASIYTVELIRGHYSSKDTLNKTENLLISIGKEAILVNDSPGFVSNRISHLMMNEAAFIVQEGVAIVKDVDAIFKQCYGHKMGPLETADLIGIDTVVDSLDVLFENFHDVKFRCCPLLRKMVDAGLFGIKSGKGFYQY